MWELYVFSILAGLFAANGVPHFVKGIAGDKHQTPFGKPSSAIVNVVWGWVNFVIAVLCLHLAHVRLHEYRAIVLIAAAALVMALFIAYNWSKHPEYNK